MTIVVPVYNEQDSLEPLMREIREVVQANRYDARIVFVDDGSQDASWSKIIQLAGVDPAVGGLRFRRNFGKAAALMAGFSVVRGDLVFTMDAVLQDPPQEIPRFVQEIGAGYDVVSGWKRHRFDPWHKVYPSRIFNKLIGLLTRIRLHDHVCGYKCYRREVLSDLRIHGELHRFLGVMVAARGYKVTEIPTLHRPRTTGVSKYGFSRFAKGFLDLITVTILTRYRWRPQHLIGVVGLLHMFLSPLLAFIFPILLLPVFGLLLIAVGVVAEMIVAERSPAGLYDIVERTGWCATEAPSEP